MSKIFQGKSVLVTGGTSGIGKATAIAFAEAGAKVVLTGRREPEGKQVVAEIQRRGGVASFFRADFSKEAEVKAAVDFVVASTTIARTCMSRRAPSSCGVRSGVLLSRHDVETGRSRFCVRFFRSTASATC